MKLIVVGALAGVLVALVVLAGGVTAAAWMALVIAVIVTVIGAGDYVRSHGGPERGR